MKTKELVKSVALSLYLLLQSTGSALAQGGTYNHEGESVATIGWIITLAKNVLSIIITLVGLGAFVMLLTGGIKILTSGGDPKSMESGKKTISMAVSGLVLAVFSWFIINIIGTITGVDLTTFSIPTLTP